MNKYSRAVHDKADQLFHRNFNSIGFDLFKKAVGEESVNEYIQRPSEEVIFNEWLDNQDEEELRDEFNQGRNDDYHIENSYPDSKAGFKNWLQEQYQNEIEDFWFDNEHYPCWSTLFEAKDQFLSEKIMENIDELYELGIGVIEPTDDTLACLFIAGAGYDFYSAHWIPMLELFGWLNVAEIEKKTQDETASRKIAMTDEWLHDLEWLHRKTTNQDIKRHAKGLQTALEAQKLPK